MFQKPCQTKRNIPPILNCFFFKLRTVKACTESLLSQGFTLHHLYLFSFLFIVFLSMVYLMCIESCALLLSDMMYDVTASEQEELHIEEQLLLSSVKPVHFET